MFFIQIHLDFRFLFSHYITLSMLFLNSLLHNWWLIIDPLNQLQSSLKNMFSLLNLLYDFGMTSIAVNDIVFPFCIHSFIISLIFHFDFCRNLYLNRINFFPWKNHFDPDWINSVLIDSIHFDFLFHDSIKVSNGVGCLSIDYFPSCLFRIWSE